MHTHCNLHTTEDMDEVDIPHSRILKKPEYWRPHRQLTLLLLATLTWMLFTGSSAGAQSSKVQRDLTAGGGQVSTGAYRLYSAIGEPNIGMSVGDGSYRLAGGFLWSAIAPTASRRQQEPGEENPDETPAEPYQLHIPAVNR